MVQGQTYVGHVAYPLAGAFAFCDRYSTPSRGQSDFGLNGDLGARQRAQ